MKANTRNIMQSKWEIDNMNMCSKRYPFGIPADKHLNSKNSRRTYNRFLKNKWRREIKRQYNEEISELDG